MKENNRKVDIEELKKYREAEAAGRLFILPDGLNDGDTIWYVDINSRVSSHMIIEWVVFAGRLFGKFVVAENEEDSDYCFFSSDDIGVHVFKTKEEAEVAALTQKEMFEANICVVPAVEVFGGEEKSDVSDNR